MLVLYLRSSSYSQFDYCKMAYFICYNLGYSQPNQKKALMGTTSHKSLEVLARCKKTIQDNPNKIDLLLEDRDLGNIDFTESILNTNKFVSDITKQSYEYYKSHNDHLEFDHKDLPFCQKMVDAAIGYNNGQYDPRRNWVVNPEISFDIPIKEDWARFEHEGKMVNLAIKGTMDLLTEESPTTGHIQDYKTGAKRMNWATGKIKEEKDFYEDPQLLLYAYAASILFPIYKHIMVTIIFLQAGGPYTVCFEPSDKAKFLQMLKKRFEEIKKCTYPSPINQNRSDFRCYRLCHYYKTMWPGTETRMCNHVEDQIKLYGIDKASKNLTKDGFKLDYYRNPGEV